jgi:hypothetical protein
MVLRQKLQGGVSIDIIFSMLIVAACDTLLRNGQRANMIA